MRPTAAQAEEEAEEPGIPRLAGSQMARAGTQTSMARAGIQTSEAAEIQKGVEESVFDQALDSR